MMEWDGRSSDMEVENNGRDKHRSKDRKKEHGSRDRERSREKGRENFDDRDSGRHESRERRKEERDYEKDHDREKEKSRSRVKDKDYGREKHREKDREHDRDKESERERSYDRDRERERHRDKEREREGERDRDRGHDRSKGRDRDHEKGLERVKGKEKDHDRAKDTEKGREKERDRVKDKEREKEKNKDREMAKDREKDRERGRLGRESEKEKRRDTEVDQDSETVRDRDKSRVGGNREKETMRRKEGEKDEKAKVEEVEEDHDRKSGSHEPSSELEERVKRMKEERLKKKSDVGSEISSWVNKSRKLSEKKNSEGQKALRLSKAFEEQDNILAENEDEETVASSGKDLAGIKILHGLDKVIEGGAVVLTLKDQNILTDGDINEEIDVLENVEIGEQKQRDEAYRAAKKKTGIYDDKFSDDMGSRRTILPQYDDPIEDEGVTLDEGGRFTGEAEKKLEELRKRIEGGFSNRSYEDLSSSGKISSDYYTSDEMLQFKKPKKKKSLRKKEKLDLDALEAEAISAGLGAGDLGSRSDLKRQFAKEEEEKAKAELRSGAYKAAYAKAEEASKILRQEQTLTVNSVEDDDLVFGEDYDDLQKSLEQARKLALKSHDETAGPQAVALLAAAKKDQENRELAGEELEENKVVITEMEEFVLGLQLNGDSHNPEAEDVFMDEEDAIRPSEQKTEDVEDVAGGWMEVKETNEDEQLINKDKEVVEPDEIIHESAVGKGLAGALKLLKDRGTLNESIDWGGRNMDKKKSKLVGINENEGTKEIRIERTDEFGRIMTPKEAFRMISHKFHGKGPGKMKQEKRMKQYQEDLKTKQMKASDTPLLAMERMKEAQARLKTPYLVLSGHVKPGQTSDPNSGFATVEKDHLGSLTPMLGDKKVEHFLGIKRKADSGSMGPPPPKKPKG